MHQRLQLLLLLIAAAPGLAEVLYPTIRVEVKTGAGPVQGAEITAGGHTARTGSDGAAVLPAALGHIDVRVTKNGFFPVSAALEINAAREWPLEIALQAQEEQREEITVYATRNNIRLQDSPLHVEV